MYFIGKVIAGISGTSQAQALLFKFSSFDYQDVLFSSYSTVISSVLHLGYGFSIMIRQTHIRGESHALPLRTV